MKILVKNMETSRDTKREIKKRLRKEILGKRDALPEEKREQFSAMIRETLRAFPEYSECEALFAFVSFGSEVDTHTLIRQAFADGKSVYCPKVTGEDMIFYKISSFNDLIPGYRGILEPKEGLESFKNWKQKNLLFMPGSVFDKERNRMGYGKGFYDRFLEECRQQKRSFVTVALAFSLQVVDAIPVEEHDVKPDYLITEKEIFGV